MRGKVHDYLRMKFYFSEKNKVNIGMIDYTNATINKIPIKLKPNDTSPYPATGYFLLLWTTVTNLARKNIKNPTQFLQKDCLTKKENVLTLTLQFQCYEHALRILICTTGKN